MKQQIITEIKNIKPEMIKYRGQLDRVSRKIAEHQEVQKRLARGDLRKLERNLAAAKVANTIEPTKPNQKVCDEIERDIKFLNNPEHYYDMQELMAKRVELQSIIAGYAQQEYALKLKLVDNIELPKDEILKSFAAFTYAKMRGGNLVENWIEISLSEWLFVNGKWSDSMAPLWEEISQNIELQIKEG
jgi:hypothetical protein